MADLAALKRGTRIEARSATDNVTQGRVVRHYTAKEVARHALTHGARAAELLPQWVVCELEDDHGSYRIAVHHSQLRVTDNRL